MFTAEKIDNAETTMTKTSVQPGLILCFDRETQMITAEPNNVFSADTFSVNEFSELLDKDFDFNTLPPDGQSQFTLYFKTKNELPFYCVSNSTENEINIIGVPMNDQFPGYEAQQLKKEMEEFAYVASHDLQEPLRKVSTYVERMMDKLPEDQKNDLTQYTDRITVSLSNMRNLIDDLLQFSRSSREPQNVQSVNLNELLERAITDNELKIEESKAKVYLQPLPSVEGDAAQLLQVFNNLILNALKFVAPNETPVIYISTEQLNTADLSKLPKANANFIKIVIRDEGIGFDQQFDQKIFQMFQRLNPKHAYKGSGIGLAICKKIISNHNGIITAQSDGKKGAAFSVILPEKQTKNA